MKLIKNSTAPIVIRASVTDTIRSIKPGDRLKFASKDFAAFATVKAVCSRLNKRAGYSEYSATTTDNGATYVIHRAL